MLLSGQLPWKRFANLASEEGFRSVNSKHAGLAVCARYAARAQVTQLVLFLPNQIRHSIEL
jgi:hypothetical protein